MDAYEIRRGGVSVPVEPEVFEVVRILVERQVDLVTKEDLLDLLWGTRFVRESSLTSRIKQARRVLGENGRTQRVIAAVHGRGYRFVAQVAVRSVDAAVAFEPLQGTRTASARRQRHYHALVGRLDEADRLHRELGDRLRGREMDDAGSPNGSFLAAARVVTDPMMSREVGEKLMTTFGVVAPNFGPGFGANICACVATAATGDVDATSRLVTEAKDRRRHGRCQASARQD